MLYIIYIGKEIPRAFLTVIFVCACFLNLSFAQDTASQIQRSEVILEKEQALREKINEPQKTYIKKIVVEGASLLTEEEIRQIISPFQRHWLTQEDIQQLIGSLRQAYQQKGYAEQAVKISDRVKHKNLIIKVEELTH